MVRVTERAASALQELLTTNQAPAEAGIRITPNERGGLAMTVDAPRQGDEVISREEIPVLIVDGAVVGQVGDMVVDCQSAEDDSQTPGGLC